MQRLLASGINKNISTLFEKFKLRKHVNVYDAKTYVERLFCIKKSTLLAKEMNNKLCGLGVAVLGVTLIDHIKPLSHLTSESLNIWINRDFLFGMFTAGHV